jgi:hypothetical protein
MVVGAALIVFIAIGTINSRDNGSADPGASWTTITGDSSELASTSPFLTPIDSELAADTALAELASLEVKGRAPKTGYDREEQFGRAWIDVDRNGCDTRNDILTRDLTVTSRDGCRVLTGTLNDPYTNSSISFVRGERTSSAVQIDHVVPLMDAWQKGAQQLSRDDRINLANDPLNLLAVDGPQNSRKSDGDAATWLPPSRLIWCEYVARQVSVKAHYRLWVTVAERDAMVRVLETCPGQLSFSVKK